MKKSANDKSDTPRVLHIHMRDRGVFLSTRQAGKEAAKALLAFTEDPGDVILDFAGVEAATPPFLQEILDAVVGLIGANRKTGRIVLAANLNEDLAETLRYVAGHAKHGVAYLDGDELDLLEERPLLVETLREAQRLKPFFTAPQLARRLRIKPDAATQRLKKLLALGAAERKADPTARHGRRHLYRVVDPRLVDPTVSQARQPQFSAVG